MKADASNFALGVILSQLRASGKLHPVAFHSRKFNATEINYEIYNKELVAIVILSKNDIISSKELLTK